MKKAISLSLTALAMCMLSALPVARAEPTPVFTVAGVYSGYDDGAVFIRSDQQISSGCANNNTVKALTDPDKLLSLALAAFLSGKKLRCELVEGAGRCAGGAPYQYAVIRQCQISHN